MARSATGPEAAGSAQASCEGAVQAVIAGERVAQQSEQRATETTLSLSRHTPHTPPIVSPLSVDVSTTRLTVDEPYCGWAPARKQGGRAREARGDGRGDERGSKARVAAVRIDARGGCTHGQRSRAGFQPPR